MFISSNLTFFHQPLIFYNITACQHCRVYVIEPVIKQDTINQTLLANEPNQKLLMSRKNILISEEITHLLRIWYTNCLYKLYAK